MEDLLAVCEVCRSREAWARSGGGAIGEGRREKLGLGVIRQV
jgi:hypothetical protein